MQDSFTGGGDAAGASRCEEADGELDVVEDFSGGR